MGFLRLVWLTAAGARIGNAAEILGRPLPWVGSESSATFLVSGLPIKALALLSSRFFSARRSLRRCLRSAFLPIRSLCTLVTCWNPKSRIQRRLGRKSKLRKLGYCLSSSASCRKGWCRLARPKIVFRRLPKKILARAHPSGYGYRHTRLRKGLQHETTVRLYVVYFGFRPTSGRTSLGCGCYL